MDEDQHHVQESRHGPVPGPRPGQGVFSRILGYAIFGSMMLTMSFLLNYYVLMHLTFFLQIQHNIWFWCLFVLATFSFVVALGLSLQYHNRFVRVLYTAAATWLGVLFIFLFPLIAYDILRHLTPLPWQTARIVILCLCLGLALFAIINARIIWVKRITLPAKALNRDVRLVQLSDLHLGPVLGARYLKRVVNKVNTLNPDFVCITGDLADGPGRLEASEAEPLKDLIAPAYFTIGNHDQWAGLDAVIAAIERTGVRVLRNEVVHHDRERLTLIGIDDMVAPDRVLGTLSNPHLRRDYYTVMLYHRPVGLETASAVGVRLMLAGHTHGGQFFPVTLFSKAFWKRYMGHYKYGDMHLYTSPGTGTWGPPIRLGTRSEILLVTLKASA